MKRQREIIIKTLSFYSCLQKRPILKQLQNKLVNAHVKRSKEKNKKSHKNLLEMNKSEQNNSFLNQIDFTNEYQNDDKELLFKFMPFNMHSLQVIVNNYLYFCHPNLLNDPLDCKFELVTNNLNHFTKEWIEGLKDIRPYWNCNLLSQIMTRTLYRVCL